MKVILNVEQAQNGNNNPRN